MNNPILADKSIWIGYEPRELDAYIVALGSIKRQLSQNIPIRALILTDLVNAGLYRRRWHKTAGRMFDRISDAPMSTEFAISRFLTPKLAGAGWALYIDCDVLARADLVELFHSADPSKAVMCVKHNHRPAESVKMDGQAQVPYVRKNWSSVMLFNCDHPSNQRLTIDMINQVPGRDLHRFCWLDDDEIGELDPAWNYLVGYTELPDAREPKLVHFTNGVPTLQGAKQNSDHDVRYHIEYADEWNEELLRWLR